MSDEEKYIWPPGSEPKAKKRMGFAAMKPELQRELARKGGSSVPSDKRSFSQNRKLARTAGAKGGAAKKR